MIVVCDSSLSSVCLITCIMLNKDVLGSLMLDAFSQVVSVDGERG